MMFLSLFQAGLFSFMLSGSDVTTTPVTANAIVMEQSVISVPYDRVPAILQQAAVQWGIENSILVNEYSMGFTTIKETKLLNVYSVQRGGGDSVLVIWTE